MHYQGKTESKKEQKTEFYYRKSKTIDTFSEIWYVSKLFYLNYNGNQSRYYYFLKKNSVFSPEVACLIHICQKK